MRDTTEKYAGELSQRAELFALLFSVIGQPTFLALPVFLAICLSLSKDAYTGLLSSTIALFTATIIPTLAVVFYSLKYKNDDRLDVVNKEDRTMPLIIGIITYFIGVALLYLVDAPRIATVLMLCYALVTVAITIITQYWKISIHSCGVIGPSIGLGLAFWPYGFLFILLLPPIAWSRYVLKKHTPLQIVMGAVVGLVITSVIFLLLL